MTYNSIFAPGLFKGQVIVVTGGGSGIGRCAAHELASFISGTVLRVDGARPQVRMGWPMALPDAQAAQRGAIKPFDGFHRATRPRLFAE